MGVDVSLPDGLSNLPGPVASWFRDMVSCYGLPDGSQAWSGLLRGRSLDDWKSMRWQQCTVELEPALLTDASWRMVVQLIGAGSGDRQNPYATEEWRLTSLSKFREIEAFMVEHGSLPGDLIFLNVSGRFEVVDGSHRLALFFARENQGAGIARQHQVWVGESGAV